MHRKQILSLLNNYKIKYPNEDAVTERFISFVQNNPNCFERTLKQGHITGSAWVLNSKLTDVLLTHHKKLDKWLQLGGHVDGNSDVLKEAMREVEEESGLTNLDIISSGIFDIDLHLIPQHKNVPEHYHYDVRFLLKTEHQDKISISDESNDLKWISLNIVNKFTTESSINRMVKKTFNFIS